MCVFRIQNPRPSLIFIAFSVLLGGLVPAAVHADETLRVTAIPRQAASPWERLTSVHWSGAALRESLVRLADTYSFHFLLDRRIDPQALLDFKADDEALGAMLARLADEQGLGCVLLDETVYIGPKNSAEILPHLLEQPPDRRASGPNYRIQAALPAEPKAILEVLAKQAGLTWKNLELLSHDLWDDTALSGTAEQILVLVLIGFEKTCEIDLKSKIITIVPLPNVVSKTRPDKQYTVKNTEKPPSEKPDVPLSRRRFTLAVEEQRLDTLLESLARRLGLELKIDEESLAQKGVALDRRVSLNVKNATATELFRALLQPLHLQFRIRAKIIEIK